MNLSPKKDFVPEYKKAEPVYKKAPPVDWSRYEIDFEKELPYGKYRGSTLAGVRHNDEWYYNWIIANNIVSEWGLLKEKFKPFATKNKEYHPLVTHTGEVWLCIYMVDVEK